MLGITTVTNHPLITDYRVSHWLFLKVSKAGMVNQGKIKVSKIFITGLYFQVVDFGSLIL